MDIPKWLTEGQRLLNTIKADDGNEEYEGWLDWSAERVEDLLEECIRLHRELKELNDAGLGND